ncbi:hypothetical protein GCM10009119_13730 [Algoriphagus jejuensis]|uniref:Uncharacterized protein n=1 Tax=Algoriphagus jejuensis TaxID=419934 RepID=A0ABN1MYX5_9BACT
MKIKILAVAAFLVASVQGELFAEKIIPTYESKVIAENDPETVIANYLKAVGGEAKIKSIKNASMSAEANFQGQVIEIKTISDSENVRLMQSTAVGGNVLQKTLLVNGKGQMVMMGQTQELPEETIAMLKPQTYVFPEQHYAELGFTLVFVGIEELEGVAVNKLQITSPTGIVTDEYYAVETGLKLKTSSSAAGDISYSDYQEVEGILFPMLLTIKNPMLPVPLEAKIVSVRFNQSLTDADFQ